MSNLRGTPKKNKVKSKAHLFSHPLDDVLVGSRIFFEPFGLSAGEVRLPVEGQLLAVCKCFRDERSIFSN